eukprot:72323_1
MLLYYSHFIGHPSKYIQNIIVYLFVLWNIYSLVNGPCIPAFYCITQRRSNISTTCYSYTFTFSYFQNFSYCCGIRITRAISRQHFFQDDRVVYSTLLYLLSLVSNIFASHNIGECEENLFLYFIRFIGNAFVFTFGGFICLQHQDQFIGILFLQHQDLHLCLRLVDLYL